MSARGVEHREHPSLARIGTFSDGVFAIAITLLVLAIRIPHPADADADQGLLVLLTREWRSYLAFVLSFMLVGISWANHRVMFKTYARADNTLVWLNLVFLMANVFVPVPTAVLGAWLGDPSNQVVAAVFYGAAATIGGILFVILWWYGAYVARLTSEELSTQQRRALSLAWGPAPLVLVILTLVAFVSPPLAVSGYVAIVLVYVLPVPRLVALMQRRRFARPSRRGPR